MVTIRDAHWTDHARLVPLVDDFARFHHRMVPSFFRPRWLGFTEAIFQSWLETDNDIHLVAEDDGVIAGYVWAARGLGNEADYAYMRRNVFVYVLAVDAAHRRKGIGRLLFAAIEELAFDFDAEIVQLSVASGNDDARAFYQSLGYTATSEIRTKALKSIKRLDQD